MPTPISLSNLLFFSSHLHHRDLHSFPTRRSSDLPMASAGLTWLASSTMTTSKCRLAGRYSLTASGDIRKQGLIAWHTWRSEEHTSELQSHHDLVCRLLLEKKKKKKTSRMHMHRLH